MHHLFLVKLFNSGTSGTFLVLMEKQQEQDQFLSSCGNLHSENYLDFKGALYVWLKYFGLF